MLIFQPAYATGTFSIWLIASAACAQPLPPKKAARPPGAAPEVIRAAIDARQAHRTAHSELSVTYYASSRKERREYPGFPDPFLRNQAGLDRRDTPVTERLVVERVGDTLRQTALGDATGFRVIDYEEEWQTEQFLSDHGTSGIGTWKFDENAKARLLKQHGQPRFALVYDGITWSHVGDAVNASAHQRDAAALSGFPRAVLDVSALGTDPFVRNNAFSFRAPSATLPWQDVPPDSTARGNARVQKRVVDPFGHAYRIEWIVDDSRGGQPVRTTLYKDDQMMSSAITSLQKVGERWFPQTVDFYRDDFAGGLEPYMTIRVDEASFDEPWHRQTPFTPEDIGFVFGTQLTTVPRDHMPVPGKLGVSGFRWDGMQLVTGEDYHAMIYLHGMAEDPTIVKGLLKGTGWSPKQYLEWQRKSSAPIFRKRWEKAYGAINIPGRQKVVREDEWDAYVREFIVKHKLSNKRKDSAGGLLKHAKGLRDFHNRKYKKAVEQAKAAGDSKKASKLEAPVKRIFKFLKRGLLRLIPRSERNRK